MRFAGLFACVLSALPLSLNANQQCTEDAMLVFDASGSMAEMGFNGLDNPRITDARAALRDVLPKVTPLRRLGLVVYGPGAGESCSHVDVRLPPTPDAADRILNEVETLTPDGNTALTRAVRDAAGVLDYRTRPGTIVLVTDGKETCGGATCRLATELAATAKNLTIHVIGFRVRDDHWGWESTDSNEAPDTEISIARCLADTTGGLYVSAETTQDLVDALTQTLGCPIYGALSRPGMRP